MEHSHGALVVDLDSYSKVVDGQLVLSEVLVHETSLDPNSLVLRQFVDHTSELIQSFMKVVNLLKHECCVELAFQEILILIQGFKIAPNCKLDQREYLRFDTAHLLIRSVLCDILQITLGESDARWWLTILFCRIAWGI